VVVTYFNHARARKEKDPGDMISTTHIHWGLETNERPQAGNRDISKRYYDKFYGDFGYLIVLKIKYFLRVRLVQHRANKMT